MNLSAFPTWSEILDFANLMLASAVAVLAFSLLAYILAYNVRTRVGRAFAALMACVLIVYTGDVLLALATSDQATLWLRLQWLGIPFVPAAYFDLSDALLQTTNAVSRRRTLLARAGYIVSALFAVLAVFTDLVVLEGPNSYALTYLSPGPLFGLFTAYYVFTSCYGLYNAYRARQRCLTPASRRRMSYLVVAFLTPAVGVFPYLVLAGINATPPASLILLLTLIGNVAVAVMLVVMTYSIAYYGVLSPDRVVKRSLIVFLIRGPLLSILVIGAMLSVPRVERILGLPRDTVLLLAVVGVIVLLQLLIELMKPTVDRLVYSQDQEELMAIRELDRRLLTTSDLRQLLENVLVAMCEYLRVPGGFVAVQVGNELLIEATCGPANIVEEFKRQREWRQLLAQATHSGNGANGHGSSIAYNGYWLWPLRTHGREGVLGLLGVLTRPDQLAIAPEEQEVVQELVERAATALEDRLLQQGVFLALQEIMPDIEQLQRWRSVVPYVGTPPLQSPPASDSIIYQPEFTQWVRDALSHYWGGPKLTDSPLLRLKVVSQAIEQEGGSVAKGMRVVLGRAIENLKPDGQRRMTASEWLLYNILDLKFIQGRRVREIADRLAMSESDLYRKQRIAIEQVAQQIAEMEASNGSESAAEAKPAAAPAEPSQR